MATQSHSTYIIAGRITNTQASPLKGLAVRAYDQDPKTNNPLGKEAVTDTEGRYTISFTEKDFKVGGVESGGPDVFIRVFDGDQLLGESPAKRNAKKRITIDLQVDLTLPAETMILHISSGQLSLGMQGPDVARIQQAMQVLGRTVPAAESAKRVLGVGSVAVLKALQADLSIPATGSVDPATVKAINVKLAKLATDSRAVRGSVHDTNRNPFTHGFVEVFVISPAGEQAIGKSPLKATDGSYEISYQPPSSSDGRVDLRIEVRNDRGPVETTPSGASLLTNAGPLEVVDFVVSAAAKPPLSEFDLIRGDLLPLLGRRDFTDLAEDNNRHDVSLLAIQSGHSREQVAAIVLAHKLAADTKTPAEMFYGLLRQGLPANASALHATNPTVRLKALRDAVDHGIVPKTVGGKNIEDVLGGFKPSAPTEFKRLLGRTLNESEINRFVGLYLQENQSPDTFWSKIAADAVFSSRAPELKLTIQLATLTNNHAPLVTAIQTRRDIKQAEDLVRLTEENWQSLIQTQGVGVPPGTLGATPDEQTRNYVQQILRQVEAAFPTQFFAERLGPSPIATLLKSRPYDLKKTYPEKFFQQNPDVAESLTAEGRNQLRSLQRVYRLTNNAQETIALSANGLRSAQQIARMDATVFAEQHKDIFSADRANEVHARARQANALALALYSENSATLNRTGLAALPRLDTETQADAASGIPDWETLFGAFDACACQQCASVHGPAAYLVDSLHFLADRGVKQALFARRPDLGDLELSCENTNTVLPFIDLVNEILEQTVAPPLPFSQTTLVPALETDLGETLATATLAAAFQPPLQPDARVEVLEAGTLWRVWDEFYAYSIVKQNNTLNVVARSRQTTGSSDERRATPQYQHSAAYVELSQAVYPWRLPFDLHAEEARVFLAHLGVARVDLIEALRPIPEPFDPTSPVVHLLAAERLGLTDMERKILTGEPLNPPRQPEDFWGSTLMDSSTKVQELLDRSGLSFAELDALLASRFVNPDQTVTVTAKPDAPVDTCDTTKLQINGLTSDVLGRMHCFVRLWRKLGWTIWEVDRAVHALTPDPNAPVLTNEVLVRLDHLRTLGAQLRLSVVQSLALWKPIDTWEPGSLYGSLFYNSAVFKPQHEDFQLRPDGQELLVVDQQLAKHTLALQAVFRLNSTGFELLVAKTDGTLNLGNLSFLYRHATLARQLRLTIQELLTVIELTGIDPFNAGQSQDSLVFVRTIKSIRESGFTIAQLDYLLRQRAETSSPLVPTEAFLAETLTETRSDLLKLKGDPDEQTKQESAVVDRVSTALELPADVTKDLLGRVKHGTKTGLVRFLELSDNTADTLARGNAQVQFETLEKLTKIAVIIQTLKFPGTQLDWLFRENSWLAEAPDPPTTPVPFAVWYSLIQLQQVRHDLSLEDAALEAILATMNAAAIATDEAGRLAAKQKFADALSTWLDWQLAILETLLGKTDNLTDRGLLDPQMPADYRRPDLLLRLHRAIEVVKRLGVSAAQAREWCEASLTDAHAKAVRRAAKAKYDDDAWMKVATPLQNSLRDKQREALVSYLVARPEKWPANAGTVGVNDLYAHLLIDVEMSSCQLTSRLVQATGSVQLFAQRCLLGRERDVQTTDPKWRQWQWMKNFRVWEANRKIWLYPENWIEPELRDGKSPFFQDLENELLQSDLDNAAAEQAFLHYLEKLDAVARLEIVGTYEDDEDEVLHVFGRTFHTPRTYYYRRREGTTQAWTPWETVDVDIEGDHLIPVVWNRKLMLIWPIFTEKQDEEPVEMPAPGNKVKGGKRHWEIQLAWSEFQYGHWTGKNLSEPVRFEALKEQPDILFGERVPRPVLTMARRRNDNDPVPPDSDSDGGTESDPDPQTPPTQGSGSQTDLPKLVPKNLMIFKARVSGDSLTVRGYLRLDYGGANTTVNSGIAFPFGEFRFYGCRKIVTTAHIAQMTNKNFPLAPKGTRFDGMWFAETGSGLTLLDGTFPSWPKFVHPTVLTEVNERRPLPTDASSTVVNRIDISVLEGTSSTFRLLAPHQDLQFVGDRPCFFMDGQRAFMVSSTGKSGIRVNPRDWVVGDLATVGLASDPQPETDDMGDVLPDSLDTLTVLVRGPNGKRVARKLTPFNLKPQPSVRTMLPTFWSTRAYTFRNFHHAYLCDFVKCLNGTGIDGLLSLETQSLQNALSFDVYNPTSRVTKEYPVDEVEFQSGGAYDLYNWELFFHIPLLIATRLRNNQRFEEAQRWFHYIFDPTGVAGGEFPQRYWRTKPFHDRLAGDYEQQAAKAIERLAAQGAPNDLRVAVDVWRENPFNPHAIARLRTTAYQKTVVMKYIDNLIAWGDQLFRRDTLESINEATQIYVLAAEILGRRRETIQRNLKPRVETFNTLEAKLGVLSNALEQIELLIPEPDSAGSPESTDEQPDPPSDGILYFCVPENDQLVTYWDTVSDRLFKIRHCMNIEGQVRQLPLFEPPIDPALLVRAQAAGLSIGDVLGDISPLLPNYRFSVMLQKANELAAEVRNLGAALLSALEKRDAEALSTLRSGQELRLLQAVRDIRKKQIDEAEASIASLEASRQMAQARKDYYESREFLSGEEQSSLDSLAHSLDTMEGSGALRGLAAVLGNLGIIKLGSPTTAGLEIGPNYAAGSMVLAASALDVASSILNVRSQRSGRMAEYSRRQDEWDHQANLATIELKQIDQQLTAAQIHLAVAEQELRNHDRQIDNAREVDQFLRGKFTNQDLHQWTIGQVSGLYFQSYQLAYDLAKRAEFCFRFELGLQDSSFIKFGYWDSLKKGLLSGEKLQYDLRRLESAYLEQNRREFELTKHISLALLDPLALIKLRETGLCSFSLPEEIFDLDYPGHYFRRMKSVSLTLPCVVGPYTTISCTLRLIKNSIRINTTMTNGYPRTADDARFIENNIPVKAIAASNAQNDSGVFELSFRDERYLPFEGAGAVSEWSLELFNDANADFGKPLRQFDYKTISDAILHVKYTAREDAGAFKNGAITHLREYFDGQVTATPSLRMFNLRQEFPTQWHRFLHPTNLANGNIFELEMVQNLFPIRDLGKTLKVNTIWLLARCTDAAYNVVTMFPAGSNTMPLAKVDQFGGLHFGVKGTDTPLGIEIMPTDPPVKWQLKMTGPSRNLRENEVEDVMLVLGYEWE